ncbi:hypothetical protein WAI453_005554 [Rhynchosporium graminicola]
MVTRFHGVESSSGGLLIKTSKTEIAENDGIHDLAYEMKGYGYKEQVSSRKDVLKFAGFVQEI